MASVETDQGGSQQEKVDETSESSCQWSFEEGTLVELRGVDLTGKQRCWNRLVQNEWTLETVSELIRRRMGASLDQRIEVSCSKMLDGGQKKQIKVADASDADASKPRSSFSAISHIVQFAVLPPFSASNSSSTAKEPAVELSAPTCDDDLVEKMIEVREQDQSDDEEEEKEDPVSSSSQGSPFGPSSSSSSSPTTPADSFKRQLQPTSRHSRPLPLPNPLLALAPSLPASSSSTKQHHPSSSAPDPSLPLRPQPSATFTYPRSTAVTAYRDLAQLRHKRIGPKKMGPSPSSVTPSSSSSSPSKPRAAYFSASTASRTGGTLLDVPSTSEKVSSSSSPSKRSPAEVGSIANGDEEDQSRGVAEKKRGRPVENGDSQMDFGSQESEMPTKKLRKDAGKEEQQQQHIDQSSSRLSPDFSIINTTTTSLSPTPPPHLTLPQLSPSAISKRKLVASEPSPSLSNSAAPNHSSPSSASTTSANPSSNSPYHLSPHLPSSSSCVDTAPSARKEDPRDDKDEGTKRRRVDEKRGHIDEEEIRERSVTTEGTDAFEEVAGGKRDSWFRSKKKEKTTKQQQPKEEPRRNPRITTPSTLYRPPPPPRRDWRYIHERWPLLPTVSATTSLGNLSSVTSRSPIPTPSRPSHVTSTSPPRVKAASIPGPSRHSRNHNEPAGSWKSLKFEKDATSKSKSRTRTSKSSRTHSKRTDLVDGVSRRIPPAAAASSFSVVGARSRTKANRKKGKRTASWQRAWMTILPWVLDHVVDTSTLASLARVSRTSLHLVGPLLYTNISLSSFQQWQSVFWFETPSPLRSHLGRDLIFTATLDLSSTELEVVSTPALAGSSSSSSSSLARITIVLPPLPSSSDPGSLTYATLKGTPLGTLMSSVLSLISAQGASASDGGPWIVLVARSDEDVELVMKAKELVWRFEEERDELGSGGEEDSWDMCEVVGPWRE